MKVKINGDEQEFANSLTLSALLESLQIRPGRVVVERNREIVPKSAYGSTILAEGDRIEIVQFVGGG